MAYNKKIEERIDPIIKRWQGYDKMKMFGGLGYLKHGNMSFGIWKGNLIVRCGPKPYEKHLKQKHVVEFDITGRPMNGWLMVEPAGFKTKASLQKWLEIAKKFASGLPAKY